MQTIGGASDGRQHLGEDPASRRRDRGRAYHQPMGYLTLSLLFVLFLLALLPTRRLWVAGTGLGFRVGYLVTLLVLGLAAVEFEALGKYMVPVLLALFLFPFTGIPAWWERTRHRGARGGIIEGHAVRLDPDDPPSR
jgi:hypothetical protein